MKKIKIVNGMTIIEQKSIVANGVKCRGFIIDEGDKCTIKIKQTLSKEEKLLTIFHELCHWIQHRKEEGNNDDEKIAREFEKIVYCLFQKYFPVVLGVFKISKGGRE